jgi:hypothetical protein
MLGFKRRSSKGPRTLRRSEGSQKSSTFQYSSNRRGSERGFDRGAAEKAAARSKSIKNRLIQIPYIAGFVCILVGIFYLSTLSTNPQLVIVGDQQLIRDKDTYQKAVHQLLASKLQYRTKVSFNGEEIASQLQTSFPELKTIEVSAPILRHRPVFELVVSSPALVFVSGTNTYLLDERGIALFDLHQTKHHVDTTQLPILTDQTSFTVELNKPALSGGQVNFIREVVGQIKAKQLSITSMELVSGGGELDVRLKDLPYKIKFNFYEDARTSVGAFLAAKEQLGKDGTKPSEYVDVRIPTRAYVK